VRRSVLSVVLVVGLSGASAARAAGDPAAPEPAKPAAAPAPPPTVNLDLGMSSVYVFRGLNMFQKSSQWDQHAFAAPAITLNVPGVEGLSIGYWGAYQWAGSNMKDKLKAGTGGENDLTLTYARPIVGKLTAGPGLTAYIYPFADNGVAGTRVPLYLEPFVVAALPTAIDLAAKVTYMHGVQEAVSAYRYVYFNPSVGKTIALSDQVSIAGLASFGYKLFIDRSTAVSEANTVDLLASVALPITLSPTYYIKPAVSWAWTNLPGISTKNEMVAFGGVNIGANL
jgi:hypothetical protein